MKPIISRIKDTARWRPEFTRKGKGQTLVLMVVILPAFIGALGLAMDVGNLYFNQYRLQTAADSAALAGATCLGFSTLPSCTSGASTVAGNYATNNGIGSTELNPNPPAAPTTDPTYCSTWDCKVTVSAIRTVPFYFARLVGVPTGTVDVTASAVGGFVNQVNNSPNLMPIGLQYSTVAGFSMGAPVTLTAPGSDACPPTCLSGDWGWVAFDASGSKPVQTEIANGYSGVVNQVASGTVCTGSSTPATGCITPEPGFDMPTWRDFTTDRSAAVNPACSSYTPKPGGPPPPSNLPCAVTVPLVDWSLCGSGGKCAVSQMPVVGFAEVWVNSVSITGPGSSNISATWISADVPGGGFSSSNPPGCPGAGGTPPCNPNTGGSGAVAIQLIQ
jgi:Flp pilus assembly protein TadG